MIDPMPWIAPAYLKKAIAMTFDPIVPRLSNMPLTRSETGHVHSPWWTFDTRDISHIYRIDSRWHPMKQAAVKAFAEVLGINEDDVVVTVEQKMDDMHMEPRWRCSSRFPVKLPERPKVDTGHGEIIDI